MTTWQRIEGLCRSEALSGGLEARVADPLWMLARQWQVGELRGDDAARPIGVSLTTRSRLLTTVEATPELGATPHPPSVPIEYLVERIGEPIAGEAGLHSTARLGHRLLRMLTHAGLPAARTPLLAKFAVPPSDAETPLAVTGLMGQTAAVLTRRALHGRQILATTDAVLGEILGTALDGGQVDVALAIIGRWRTWAAACGAQLDADGWDDERLEYSFSVTVNDEAGTLGLQAAEHTGGVVDWFTFDHTGATPAPTSPKPLPTGPGRPTPPRPPVPTKPSGDLLRTVTTLPSPVQYRGQPAPRWWEYEDGATNFADIDAGPADLARLLVTEFAVAFSNDWFVVPARLPVGSVTDVVRMAVVDNFGDEVDVLSTAVVDDDPKGARPWRMFELTGDELTSSHRSPWLFVPPTVLGDLTGAPLERVSLVRDEGANLVWGIEKLVEGPAGRSVDRALLGSGTADEPGEAGEPGEEGETALGAADTAPMWSYHLEAGAPPPFWIPFVPERITRGDADVVLRRARMQQWEAGAVATAGPHGVVLDARRPCWIREEEVARSGVRVDRRWRYARGDDGIGHLWLQLEKRPGQGERSSGVRWDVIEISTP